MESRKQIMAFHNNYSLTSHSTSYIGTFDSSNTETAHKPNAAVHLLLLSQNNRNYSEHVLDTLSLFTYNKCQHWGPILSVVSILNMYIVHDKWHDGTV